ncbi:hypothetical protein C8J57DRAFT_1531854 [Mycena rebaudengoi]|nr:hypothetical protein C8J57DRAFT_1531854 [Mycena rebaudengoi]
MQGTEFRTRVKKEEAIEEGESILLVDFAERIDLCVKETQAQRMAEEANRGKEKMTEEKIPETYHKYVKAAVLFMKKNAEAIGDLDGRIRPLFKFSSRNSFSFPCSVTESGYILQPTGDVQGISQGINVAVIVVESAALYSFSILSLLIEYTVLDLTSPLIGIAFTAIILRVGLGLSGQDSRILRRTAVRNQPLSINVTRLAETSLTDSKNGKPAPVSRTHYEPAPAHALLSGYLADSELADDEDETDAEMTAIQLEALGRALKLNERIVFANVDPEEIGIAL